MAPPEEEPHKALVDGVPTELVFVADGYMAPSSFRVRKDLRRTVLSTKPSLATRTTPPPAMEGPIVTIEVAIENKHVISRRVVVEDPKGVSSITLRQIQVREWVATDLLDLLRRARIQDDGTTRPERISESEIDEALEIVRRLVGYAPQVIGGGRPSHKQEPEA
jgi:hypothetical protein